METMRPDQATELSTQELDEVAGGASRKALAFTAEHIDNQFSTLEADRNGVRSITIQQTDDFNAALFEDSETGQ